MPIGARSVQAAVVVALLARLAFGLGYWTGKPLTHDEREYLTIAINLAQGRGFAATLPGEPPPGAGGQVFDRGPGYPLFLAPLTVLDADLRAGRLPADVPAAVQAAQAILGAAGVWLLAGIVRRVAGDRAAPIAAWIAASYPPLVWMPAYALSEQLASTLALAAAAWLGRVTDGDADRRATGRTAIGAVAVAGVLAGIGALTRPGQLVVVPLAALLLWLRAPDRAGGLARAAIFAGAALAAIAPWTVRNAAVHDRLVLVAASGGVNFWIGNHREAIGEGDLAANPHLKLRNQAFRAAHAGLSEAALEPLYYRDALDGIAADPIWWLGLEARKLAYTFAPIGPSYRLHGSRYYWTTALSLGLLLPVAVIGLLRAPARMRPAALFTFAAATVVAGLVFFPHERFRLPVIDPALVAAAALAASRGRNGVV